LTINGIQTQSALVHTLIHELDELSAMGVDVIRLSPQSQHMEDVVRGFRAVLEGEQPAAVVHTQLEPRMPAGACNGYWHGRPGLEMVVPQTEGVCAWPTSRNSAFPRRWAACWACCPSAPAPSYS